MDHHQVYVDRLEREVQYCYQLARQARQQRLDPENEVNIPLAKNMAERVAGIISIVAPQLIASPMAERIQELEKEYSKLDWRVGFQIAEEVAREKFCRFADQREAVEVGIRVGFAYLTLGIVAAPLEGFIGLKIKKTAAGKEYLSLQYAGPIRGAGGTAAASSVILADYVRVKMGYAPYDPTEQEISRSVTEVHDYHERVTNLQYHPSNEELDFLLRRLPVEVDGDPTEKIEVSNYKDLPRIETNLIRGGVCLVLAEGLSQKAPKLWKKLKSWGKEWGIDWSFLEQFLELQKKIKAKESAGKNSEAGDNQKIKPNFTYINDLVAGRPILTHPLQKGGFRLRYGRSRTTGFSTAGLHPATLVVLDKYIAVGTQLKVERPGKAVTVALCDTIEGPVVKTKDGSVLILHTEKQAKEVCSSVDEILFLGDILINYGDFSENGHLLVPAGYCEEWWMGEVQRVFQQQNLSPPDRALALGLSEERLRLLCDFPLITIPSVEEAVRFSQQLSVPLHPRYTYHWKHLSGKKLQELHHWFLSGRAFVEQGKIKKFILPLEKEYSSAKYSLEEIGLPHVIANSVMAVIEEPACVVLDVFFSLVNREQCQSLAFNEQQDALTQLNAQSPFLQRDKSGTFIGARMGRPEKVKMRKLTGSPQVMFPVGEEGDRLRSFQAALERGSVTADFPNFFCTSCAQETIYSRCERCQHPTELRYYCRQCGDLSVRCRHDYVSRHKKKKLDIRHYFTSAQQQVGMQTTPDLIKGVRGTSNKDHVVEHLAKGLLRAKHNVYVNKDGTIRVDCTEMPLTHFKPKEIGTPLEKLRALGYETDIAGRPLDNEDQIVELQPQDIVLPNFPAFEGSCGQALLSVGNFIDDLLVSFYGQEAYYQFTSERDLIGHLVVGLAPHISAGLIGRIIGFSETQVLLAHPLWHAGLRRDCLGYDTFVPIYDGRLWEMKKIGELVESLQPQVLVDQHGTLGKKVSGYFTLGYNTQHHRVERVPLVEVTKHSPSATLTIRTENGRQIECTPDHIFYIQERDTLVEKTARSLSTNDRLAVPYHFNTVVSNDLKEIFLPDIYSESDLMISGITGLLKKKINSKRTVFCKKYTLPLYELKNYLFRGSWPKGLVQQVLGKVPKKATISIKRNFVKLPATITLAPDVLWLIGLYIAEGHSRKNTSRKGFYQVGFAATESFIRQKIKRTCRRYFNLAPSRETAQAIIYSSKLFYLFFTASFPCGSRAQEKRIPPRFLTLPLPRLKYLLQGYFDGDGSTDRKELRVTCDTVSSQLLEDLYFVFGRYGIYFKKYESERKPGKPLQRFYLRKGRAVPYFRSTKITIPSNYCSRFAQQIGFSLPRKQKILLTNLKKRKIRGTSIIHDEQFAYLRVSSVTSSSSEKATYCLRVENTHNFIANNFVVHNCDGDEAAVMLLLDALLNFSRQYLPEKRGAKTMDSPLVLTTHLDPAEVDDQVQGIDVVWKYPVELYEAALQYQYPWEVKVEQLKTRVGTEKQYSDFGFTHQIDNFNNGITCSAYKILPTMEEKLAGQMELARKIRAVDTEDVAKLVIEKHLIRDIRGNLRKFSTQQFRCVKCNAKYRRPPLIGCCTKCRGNLLFTISEGSATKYLELSLSLAEKYDFSPYLKQSLEITKNNIDTIFGREKEKQIALGAWVT